jgi:hypothetical protein
MIALFWKRFGQPLRGDFVAAQTFNEIASHLFASQVNGFLR